MRWDSCHNETANATDSMRSTLWKQTAAGHRCMHYKKDRLVLPPPVTDITPTVVSISSLSSGDTGKYSGARVVVRKSTKALARRRPPIPEEEATCVLEGPTRYHHRPEVRHDRGVILQRREILKLADPDEERDGGESEVEDDGSEDKLSLCSRDMEIKSAASQKASFSLNDTQKHQLNFALSEDEEDEQAEGEKWRPLPPRYAREQSPRAHRGGGTPASSRHNHRPGGVGEDPPGHMVSRRIESETEALWNIERLLGTSHSPINVEHILLESNDKEPQAEQPEALKKKATGIQYELDRLRRVSPEVNNSSTNKYPRLQYRQEKSTPTLARRTIDLSQGEGSEEIGSEEQEPLLQQTDEKRETSKPRILESVARLNVAKMEEDNQKAAEMVPVVQGESIASTHVKRLDWTTVTQGLRVFGGNGANNEDTTTTTEPSSAGSIGFLAQIQSILSAAEENKHSSIDTREKIEPGPEENTGTDEIVEQLNSPAYDPKQSVANPSNSVDMSQSESPTCTSQDITEKAGTNRKKLLNIKNIKAKKPTSTVDVLLSGFDNLCVSVCSFLLCE